MFKKLFCGLVVCISATVGAMSADTGEVEGIDSLEHPLIFVAVLEDPGEIIVSDAPPVYVSKYMKSRAEWRKTRRIQEGYAALQQKYPHIKKDYDSTKRAMEHILADARAKTFVAKDMQAVMDYFHWWYYIIDPCDMYEEKVHYVDEDGVAHVTWFERHIKDLVAKILDELQDTGGTACASLHWKKSNN